MKVNIEGRFDNKSLNYNISIFPLVYNGLKVDRLIDITLK